MPSKKEGAQRILDAPASSMKVKQRFVPIVVGIAIVGVAVTALTRWQFGLATVLMCGLLLQYAIDRMNTILDASVANGLKDMGWDIETEITDEILEKIRSVAER